MSRPQSGTVRPLDKQPASTAAVSWRPPWTKVIGALGRRFNTTTAVTPIVPASSSQLEGPAVRATHLRRSSSHRASRETLRERNATRLRFLQAFGLLGPPLLFVALVSAMWTAALIALNFAPNDVANALMGTTKLDNGSFWLIIDTEAVLLGVTLFGLALVFLGYAFVALKMTIWRNNKLALDSWEPKLTQILSQKKSASQLRILSFMDNLTSYHGVHRKIWVSGIGVYVLPSRIY